MKQRSIAAFVLLLGILLLSGACGGKRVEDPDCKICYALSLDGIEEEQEVCSQAEETDFRKENAGKDIACQ